MLFPDKGLGGSHVAGKNFPEKISKETLLQYLLSNITFRV